MNVENFDVLVIGGGAAGLYTALCLSEALTATHSIGLVTKDNLSISASDWAQGGIAAVVAEDDSPQLHAEDTLQAGAGLCELQAVEVLVREAKPQIDKLLALGVDFDRLKDGDLALTLEAAHSRRRVLHAADATGRALVSSLAAQVLERSNIRAIAETLVVDLCLQGDRCVGVSTVHQGQPTYFLAPIVVLATGGGAQVFAQTTNPPASTGDGVAIAWRAGAVIRDMEFVQFHPTALAISGAPRFLISEAVRGEGAHLIDHQGDRFTFRYDRRGELAPRDVVSRAIFNHLQETGEPTVFLDLQSIPAERIAYRFPNIIRICQQWHIDIFSAPIPVTPAAHYCMGGIVTDTNGATSIAGLYAVGETASTGVHGANRLASNSLLECFVFGARLAKAVSQQILSGTVSQPINLKLNSLADLQLGSNDQLSALQQMKTALRELTWHAVGISRIAEEMETALAEIKIWQQQLGKLISSDRLSIETRNLADFAYLLVRSALLRQESRGAHYRVDYPDTLSEWQAHTVIHREQIYRQALNS